MFQGKSVFPNNKKDFIHLFLERGKGGRKRGRETLVASHLGPDQPGYQTHNPGLESNWQLFALQEDAQPMGFPISEHCSSWGD